MCLNRGEKLKHALDSPENISELSVLDHEGKWHECELVVESCLYLVSLMLIFLVPEL